MYHETIQDRKDKKRQRLTPPPNGVWMDARLSKGKTSDGYIPTTVLASSEMMTTATMNSQQTLMQYPQQYTTRYEGTSTSLSHVQVATRAGERATLYQGRVSTNSIEQVQGRGSMDVVTPYKEVIMTASEAVGNTVEAVKYQGRMMDSYSLYQKRMIQSRWMDNAAAYQGRSMERDEVYQGSTAEGAVVYQGRKTDGGHQQGKLIQGQGIKAMEDSTGKIYQGEKVEGPSGKMTADYKRDKKLPPRVEEMLREQVNLDEDVLHDAFALAMEDLILEREANFVVKGLCHLCGVKEKHYMPVVNFCPHADENHSLCREHLRSVYRVRLEALFVGRNGATPNRRLLRCLVCAHGCPCTLCRAEKERKVHKYKCYLLDTLRRNGQGSVSAMSDEHAIAAVASPVPAGHLTRGAVQSSKEGHQYAQYPPTLPAKDRPSVQRGGLPARSPETEAAHDGRRLVQPQQLEYKHYPQNSRNGYGSKVQTYSVQMSSTQASSMHASNLLLPRMQTSGVQAFSMQPSGMQTQQMHSSRCPLTLKQAENDTSANCLSAVGDGATVADRRVAARVAAPGSTELPSASTILNCSESEKSLVHLLSSLNQGGAPPGSVTSDLRNQFSKDSTCSQSKSRYATKGIAGNNGPSGNANGLNDTETEAASLVHHARGIVDRRRQARDQSYTSSMDSGNSPLSKCSSFGARSIKKSQVLKRKANESEDEASPEPRDSHSMTSRDDFRAPHRSESAASGQRNGGQPSSKPNGRGKESAVQADTNENQSSQTPPHLPSHRVPGRSRKISDDVVAPALLTSRAGKKGPQQRKTTKPSKRGRGRPPKCDKRAKSNNEEIADETNEEEDKENDEEEGGLESELDANLDYCEVCQGAGDLVCCDKCPRTFHLKCLHMTETDLPEGDWQCNECKKPSRFDAYAVAVALEKSMLDKCLKIVQCLQSHPFSKQFLSPVENVPMYARVVKQPMDLSTIENKLKKGAYTVDSNTVADGVNELDFTLFANDIRLMWSNCKLFNNDGSGIARAADILSAGFERLYKESIAPSLSS